MLLLASFTCLDACCCHGLRLPVFNKETTYLLTYLLRETAEHAMNQATGTTTTVDVNVIAVECRGSHYEKYADRDANS